VESGFAKVVGTKKAEVLSAIHLVLKNKTELPPQSPFGDGKSAERIVKIIEDSLVT